MVEFLQIIHFGTNYLSVVLGYKFFNEYYSKLCGKIDANLHIYCTNKMENERRISEVIEKPAIIEETATPDSTNI